MVALVQIAASLAVALLPVRTATQERATTAELQAAVEACLAELDDAKAQAQIAALATRCAGDPQALLRALTTPPARPAGARFEVAVPWQGAALKLIVVPPARASDGAPPVIFDLFWNTVASWYRLTTPVVAWVEGEFIPPEFSDTGRDAWRKFLHTASFVAGGDPDRLWLTGFSWSGHACFDFVEHRPGVARGIVALGSAPRRNHWRLLKNVAGARLLACCGGKDDAEMVWNLEELARSAAKLGLDVDVTIDPDGIHQLPLQGMDAVAAKLDATPVALPLIPASGTLLADGDHVALPWLEIVAVDPDAVDVPARVPVSSSLSRDQQRQATIRAMDGKVAKLEWKRSLTKEGVTLAFTAKGVRSAALLVKAPWLDPALPLTVTVKGKRVHAGIVAIDPALALHEARRTGDRQRPTVARIELRF